MSSWKLASADRALALDLNVGNGPLNGTLTYERRSYRVTGGWAAAGSVAGRNASAFALSGSMNSDVPRFIAAAGIMTGSSDNPTRIDIRVEVSSSSDGSLSHYGGVLVPPPSDNADLPFKKVVWDAAEGGSAPLVTKNLLYYRAGQNVLATVLVSLLSLFRLQGGVTVDVDRLASELGRGSTSKGKLLSEMHLSDETFGLLGDLRLNAAPTAWQDQPHSDHQDSHTDTDIHNDYGSDPHADTPGHIDGHVDS